MSDIIENMQNSFESRRKGISVFIEDKKFISIIEASAYYNKKYSTVLTRLSRGWTIEEALGIVERDKNNSKYNKGNSNRVQVDGKGFKSIKQAITFYDKKVTTVYSRLQRGWTLDEALDIIPRNVDYHPSNSIPITVEGQRFPSLRHACKCYNKKYNTVFVRIKRGWTIEEALELVER